MSLTARLGRHSTAASVALLAILAYVPALASSPGRMPADTKLYLYFDPARLLGRAASTFEPDQFAGWVPHQQITYLWPSGPWYLLFDGVGLPDWLAHRLWIGTIMFLAGAGVMWAARVLGVPVLGAVVAGIVYQTSPFLLPYISRTSLLLLPWAALGWIVALTVRATQRADVDGTIGTETDDRTGRAGWRRRLGPWREPALIALIVATVGSANATTLAMIVPAPVLWIVHTAWQGRISWRQAIGVVARIAALCLAVSIWWISMLLVQARHGAPVLNYSETLEDVSRNATGSEVVRALGYWLFYQRDAFAPTTTASFDHLVSLRTIAVSYAVIIVGVIGLAVTSWPQRRFAAMCVAVGAVLAVGVHPIDRPSPLMALLVNDDGSGLALALRSSTRALPVFLLGIALGAGALVSAIPARLPADGGARSGAGLRRAAALGVGLLAVANLPSLWNRAFVDPAIDRDQDPPAAWNAAVDALDGTDPGARVLQLPGAEFGAFRWGYTVDPPLVGLSEKPLVTRDLLPLGSAGAMDLLFSLDDRFQESTIEADAVAPVARLLGSDTLWLSNDAEFERFRTARPELVDALLTADRAGTTRPAGLGPAERFGEPVANTPQTPMIDPSSLVEAAVGRPLSPVALVPVEDPVGVIRAKTSSVVVSGSGDGIVDAAAEGLLSGRELVRYSASLDGDALAGALEDADLLIVTDSNRDQAHHWRGSQDVRGHTEPGGPAIDVLDATGADQRLEVFAPDADRQTIAIQDGPVRAIASSYGEPFAYRPEDRAVFAIDGDPATAWTVADHGNPIGERIRLDLAEGATATTSVDSLRLQQPAPVAGGRSISAVSVTVDDHPPVTVDLDQTSFEEGGQTVEIPAVEGGGTVTVEITEIAPGRFPSAASFAGVGFSEIDLGLGPTTEVIRVPTDGLDALSVDTPLALLFTRWRTDPTDPWRADPEPELRRRFELPTRRTVDATATLRLDRRATDAALAELLAEATTSTAPIASTRVTGGVAQRGVAAVDGDPATAWITGFDDSVGAVLGFDTAGPIGTEITISQPAGAYSPITGVQLRAEGEVIDAVVPPPDESGRSTIELPITFVRSSTAGPLEFEITAIDERTTIDRRYGDPRVLPAAIAELDVGIEPVTTDRGASLVVECSPDFLDVDGRSVPISFETTVGALLDGEPVVATACSPLELPTGFHDVTATRASALTVDRVALTDRAALRSAAGAATVEVTRDEPRARDVVVGPCPDGCWIVLGEGFNDAWEASVDGRSLGSGQLVDGGFNGWWLEPATSPARVEFRWTAQRPVTLGLGVSVLAVLACIGVALAGPRPRPERLRAPRLVAARSAGSRRPLVASTATLVAASVALVAPIWGIAALATAALSYGAATRVRGRWTNRVHELVGVALLVLTALAVVWIEWRDRPYPNAGWTTHFDHLNGGALFAVIVIAVGAMFAPDAEREHR
jgi:arabinofuranan 3-O-arabinosyltransferase